MTDLVAAFPMYSRPELRPAFDMLWEGTRDNLRASGVEDVPDRLTVVDEGLLRFWQRSDLLLSQTCGFPYRHFLKDRVALVGTPDFGLEGCPPGHYRSALVIRRDDPRETMAEFQGATLAVNDLHSQSGYAAPLLAMQQAGLRVGEIRMSGAHVASARMVATGGADIAGLDAVSWRHMQRLDDWTCGLRVLCWTAPTPGLPFVTAFSRLAATITASLAEALRTLPATLRDDLTMKGLVAVDRRDYLIVADPEAPERSLFRS